MRSNFRAHAVSAQGFTLLEMLISVSLLALIITLAYGSLRVAVGSSRSGEALIERSEELRTTQAFLRRQLSQAMNVSFERLNERGEEKRFEGDRQRVMFVAPMPGYLSRGGAHVQELALVEGDNGLQLEFRHAQLNGFDAELGFDSEQEPVVLMDGLRDGAFEFRTLGPDGALDEWSSDWEDPRMLPILLRLSLGFDEQDRRHWPEFEVALRAGAAGASPFLQPRTPPVGPTPVNPRPREAP